MSTKTKGGAGLHGRKTRVIKEKYKGQIRETIVGFFRHDGKELPLEKGKSPKKKTLCEPDYLREFKKGKARTEELERLWDQMLAELLKEVEEKKVDSFEYTVGDLIDLFLETKLSGKKDVADPTRRLKYWKGRIGKRPVLYVDKQGRSLWSTEILKEKTKIKKLKCQRGIRKGLPILDRTVNGYFEDLRRLFSFAIELGKIDANPVRRGLVFETVDKSRNERKRELGEHEGEKEALIEACRPKSENNPNGTESPDLWDAFRFASWIGCRAGEMYKLKWTDVNLKDGILKFKDRKNESDQEINLSENLDCLQMLRERKLKSSGERKKRKGATYIMEKTNLVFPSSVAKAWNSARKKAGIGPDSGDDSRFTWHDLRHTFATMLRRQGVSIEDIAHSTGHADRQSTLRYAHVNDEIGKKNIGIAKKAFNF